MGTTSRSSRSGCSHPCLEMGPATVWLPKKFDGPSTKTQKEIVIKKPLYMINNLINRHRKLQRKVGRYILLLPPKIPITIRLMTWLNYIHTYIHTYMHTCASLPSPMLSASMRDGLVVGCLLMKEDGWIGGSSGMIIGLLPSRRTTSRSSSLRWHSDQKRLQKR